ncbi:MAG: DUF433 domain-containing protein [Acidobacteriota bacterium]|nr:DUF433 domain-containing protein [Acidobacteriota bacterium]
MKGHAEQVVRRPEICGGEPCIRGIRIPISVILDNLVEGLSPAQIAEEYPPLTLQDIEAARRFAGEKL